MPRPSQNLGLVAQMMIDGISPRTGGPCTILGVGDSHWSGIPARWLTSWANSLPITVVAWMTESGQFADKFLNVSAGNHTVTNVTLSSGVGLSPIPYYLYAWSGADANDVGLMRYNFKNLFQFRNGNWQTSKALNFRMVWIATSDSITLMRGRAGRTTEDGLGDGPYTTDLSTYNPSTGAGAWVATLMPIAAHATLVPRADFFTVAAGTANGKKLYLPGGMLEVANATSGCRVYAFGNGGADMDDYLNTSLCSDANLQSCMNAYGVPDVIWLNLTTNVGSESTDVLGAGKVLARSVIMRLKAACAAIGGSPVIVLDTGFDCNNASRLADFEEVYWALSNEIPNVAFINTFRATPTWAVLQAASLQESGSVHMEASGAAIMGAAHANALLTAYQRTGRRLRFRR